MQVPFWLQVAGPIIATLALIAAIASLTWQIVSWRRTGAIPTLEIIAVVSVTFDDHEFLIPLEMHNRRIPIGHEYGANSFMVVRIRNLGRIPITATEIKLRIGIGNIQIVDIPRKGKLPARIDSGDQFSLYFDFEMVRVCAAACMKEEKTTDCTLTSTVWFGNGKQKSTSIGLTAGTIQSVPNTN